MKSWLPIAVAAFVLGYVLGHADLPARLVRSADPGVGGDPPAANAATVAAAPERASPATAGADTIQERVLEFERLLFAGRSADAAMLLDELIDQARAWSTSGAGGRAIRLADALVAADPYDYELLLLASELRQQQGQLIQAMEPLLVLLARTDAVELRASAREQLRLLVNVQEIQLVNRQDYQGVVRLFEELVSRDPGYDGHRLSLARWLLRSGRVVEAERVARELGSVGVPDSARADLLAEIDLARDGLPLERDGRTLHVRATIDGRPARLLVDTGATTTVVSAGLAQSLGSRVLETGVGVRTAGGTVSGELHRVRDLRVGRLHLPELDVLVLERVPVGADGLLGMDVLGRIPPGLLPATLLGRPPVSG